MKKLEIIKLKNVNSGVIRERVIDGFAGGVTGGVLDTL